MFVRTALALADLRTDRPPLWHPGEAQLEAFMRSELPQREVLDVVRHLLHGCTRCQSVTRRLWELGEGR